MESSLDKIAEGTEAWKMVLKSTWSSYKDRYTVLKAQPGTASTERRRVLGTLVAVIGKKGPLLLKEGKTKEDTVFYGWPEGVAFEDLTEEEAAKFANVAGQAKQGMILGTYEDHPILKKSGKFGPYIVWNGNNLSYKPEDTLETIITNLKAKQDGKKLIGAYTIQNGPYGLYMFKSSVVGPSRKFVSVPASLDLDSVTESDLNTIFQEGLKSKAKAGAYGRGGGSSGRGGFRGRGSWRGKK
jgi:topoisomerase IA-like protein